MTSTMFRAPASVAEIAGIVADAAARRRTLRITGGASWLDANRPVAADATLATRTLDGIVEYVPGDLTLTARAGTTLAEIARTTAEHGQWLALDPPGDAARSTLGATIATASYGALAHHAGTPRDITLGVEFVTGRGDIVRGGGRVVKNVAGYDLTRLVTGAWGTLGVITEATVRLRALPPAIATLSLGVDVAGIDRLHAALRALPFTPLAAQLVSAPLAGRLGLAPVGGPVLVVRLGGNQRALAAQRDAIAALGAGRATAASDDVWDELRAAEPADAAVVRLSRMPSRFAECFTEARQLADRCDGALVHGDPGRGVVRCILPPSPSRDDVLLHFLSSPSVSARIAERLPAALWSAVPAAAADPLSRRVADAFDPAGIFNPGILGAPS